MEKRFQLAHKLVTIKQNKYEPAIVISGHDQNVLRINRYDVAVKFLHSFGKLISKLEFHYDSFTEEEVQNINHHIEQHCAKTLIDLTVKNVKGGIFTGWNNVFERVENVEIYAMDQKSQLRLAAVYPQMRSLSITQMKPIQIDVIAQDNLQLKHLTLNEVQLINSNVVLRELLETNQQVESLTTNKRLSVDDLSFINEKLPELKALDIATHANDFYNNPNNEIIRFNNVEEFSLRWERGGAPLDTLFPLAFHQLTTFFLYANEIKPQIIRFISDHSQIKRLVMPSLELSYCIQMLTDKSLLPHLTEITVKWTATVSSHGIAVVMRGNDNLKRINLIVSGPEECSILLKMVPAEWHLTSNQGTDKHNESVVSFEPLEILSQ